MTFKYKKHSSKYRDSFDEMKKKILELASKKPIIEHIGSTSVEGVGGKGIIDISIGIRKWSDSGEILSILKRIGFEHFHSIENHSIFVSTKALCEESDFHVHIGRIGTKRYRMALDFRDCLRKNYKLAKEYSMIKKEAFQKGNGDRKKYKELKNEWFLGLDSK